MINVIPDPTSGPLPKLTGTFQAALTGGDFVGINTPTASMSVPHMGADGSPVQIGGINPTGMFDVSRGASYRGATQILLAYLTNIWVDSMTPFFPTVSHSVVGGFDEIDVPNEFSGTFA